MTLHKVIKQISIRATSDNLCVTFFESNLCNFYNFCNLCNLRLNPRSFSLTPLMIKWFILLFLPLVTSCASAPTIQPQVNSFVVAEMFQRAAKILDSQPQPYGPNNELLYLLDKGYVLHMTGDYPASIQAFEQAKHVFDDLYTKSLTKVATTWLVNDYSAPYRGEDFERVMINIFQALNYAASGNLEEALVEARDVDSVLSSINLQYKAEQKNVYREDAFARFLMGILYEAGMNNADYNDSYISYTKASQIYEKDYQSNYELFTPGILKENMLTMARFMGKEEFEEYREKFKDVEFKSLDEKNTMAEVYLIQYNGLVPIKLQNNYLIPLPDGYVTKFAFPVYYERQYDIQTSRLNARNDELGKTFQAETEVGEDIGAIAKKNLEARRLCVMAKAALRPMAKYALERAGEGKVKEKAGDTAAVWYRTASSLYNVFTEQADLRSWQTLPAQIRIGRLLLKPGAYVLSVTNLDEKGCEINQVDLGEAQLKAGDKKFFIIRTAR